MFKSFFLFQILDVFYFHFSIHQMDVILQEDIESINRDPSLEVLNALVKNSEVHVQ